MTQTLPSIISWVVLGHMKNLTVGQLQSWLILLFHFFVLVLQPIKVMPLVRVLLLLFDFTSPIFCLRAAYDRLYCFIMPDVVIASDLWSFPCLVWCASSRPLDLCCQYIVMPSSSSNDLLIPSLWTAITVMGSLPSLGSGRSFVSPIVDVSRSQSVTGEKCLFEFWCLGGWIGPSN